MAYTKFTLVFDEKRLERSNAARPASLMDRARAETAYLVGGYEGSLTDWINVYWNMKKRTITVKGGAYFPSEAHVARFLKEVNG